MKAKNPMISIIIPVFNGAAYLEETVSSIQNSKYKNFEIILVDDGSTKDNSKQLVKRLEKYYKNVRNYSFARNKGMDFALNLGLKKAQGKYIARVNQDDIMHPQRLGTQVAFLNKHKDVVAVGSNIQLFTSRGKFKVIRFLRTDREIKKIWMALSPFSDPTVMYRKGAALVVGGYEQQFWPADDVHMWYKLGKIGKLANIQQILMDIRWHEGAGSLLFFRLNTKRTYKLHRWAHRNIEKASIFVQLFWVGQFICGMLLTPSFNWKAYREIKSVVNFISSVKTRSHILSSNKHARPLIVSLKLKFQLSLEPNR